MAFFAEVQIKLYPCINTLKDLKLKNFRNLSINFRQFLFSFRSMNGSLPRPELHNSDETDPDSWSCSRSRETSPESSIPPGMPSFRVIPLTCESEAGSSEPFCNEPQYSGTLLRGSEPPEWETEPLQRSGSAQPPPATLLRKNQYWV